MGNCWRSSSENEGININERLAPMLDLSTKTKLTESDVEMITKRIHVIEYNTKLYEKRNLQSQRAKFLSANNKKPNDQYLALIRETKELENEILETATEQVLKDYKVNIKIFKESIEVLNKEKIDSEVTKALKEEITGLQMKLGLNEKKLGELNVKYKDTYREADFMLSSHPDIAQRLSLLFENELCLNSSDVIASDILYDEYKLLPIELVSFVNEY